MLDNLTGRPPVDERPSQTDLSRPASPPASPPHPGSTPAPGEAFWEQAFREDARPFGPPSEEILEIMERLPRSASVLDLGCGDGRNAIPLARAGHQVTAVDRSKHALGSLRRAVALEGEDPEAERPLGMELVEAELGRMAPLGRYDLIIAHGVLHLLPPSDRDWLISRMKEHTVPGGWNIVAAFTHALPPPPDMAGLCLGLLDPGSLFLRYGDWDIELEQSYVLEDEHPGGIRHRHPVEKVVARRPLDAT
jgi:tellurite methyltransferase